MAQKKMVPKQQTQNKTSPVKQQAPPPQTPTEKVGFFIQSKEKIHSLYLPHKYCREEQKSILCECCASSSVFLLTSLLDHQQKQ